MVIVRAYRRKGKRRVVAVRRHNRGKLRQQGMSRDEAERKLYEHNSKKSATEKGKKTCQFCGQDVNLMEYATYNRKPCHGSCYQEAKKRDYCSA